MGGRGASSGIANNGKKYGTEYETLYKISNIKFVRYKDSGSSKAPMETMTKGRIYVTVNENNQLSNIIYYDNNNKRIKQVDILHAHRDMKLHTHHGYYHNENDGIKGATKVTKAERRMIDTVMDIWYNKKGK